MIAPLIAIVIVVGIIMSICLIVCHGVIVLAGVGGECWLLLFLLDIFVIVIFVYGDDGVVVGVGVVCAVLLSVW